MGPAGKGPLPLRLAALVAVADARSSCQRQRRREDTGAIAGAGCGVLDAAPPLCRPSRTAARSGQLPVPRGAVHSRATS